jgi:hypothetical protein
VTGLCRNLVDLPRRFESTRHFRRQIPRNWPGGYLGECSASHVTSLKRSVSSDVRPFVASRVHLGKRASGRT